MPPSRAGEIALDDAFTALINLGWVSNDTRRDRHQGDNRATIGLCRPAGSDLRMTLRDNNIQHERIGLAKCKNPSAVAPWSAI